VVDMLIYCAFLSALLEQHFASVHKPSALTRAEEKFVHQTSGHVWKPVLISRIWRTTVHCGTAYFDIIL